MVSQISTQQASLAKLFQGYVENFEYHKILEAIELAQKSYSSAPNLSPEWVTRMQKAIDIVDIDLMDSLINELKSDRPTLAERLQNYRDRFEYHKIFNAIG